MDTDFDLSVKNRFQILYCMFVLLLVLQILKNKVMARLQLKVGQLTLKFDIKMKVYAPKQLMTLQRTITGST